MSDDDLYLEVDCEPRYWEDATVNGVEDTDGTLIPFREGDSWRPVINLNLGDIVNWPQGMEARIHYKVCDAGEYYIRKNGKRISKYKSAYVPNNFLCHGANAYGYGDYIILNVRADGHIKGYQAPFIVQEQWEMLDELP